MADTETGDSMPSGVASESSYSDFLALFSCNSRRIYGFVRTLVIDANDANDVYQSTAMCLWQKYGSFSPGTSFFAWACQIAQREVMKYRHQKCRHRHFPEELVDLLATSFQKRVDDFERREQALRDCIKHLPQDDQSLIEQRYFHDQKPKDLAATQSRSVHSIYRSLGRIHEQLERCIGRRLRELA